MLKTIIFSLALGFCLAWCGSTGSVTTNLAPYQSSSVQTEATPQYSAETKNSKRITLPESDAIKQGVSTVRCGTRVYSLSRKYNALRKADDLRLSSKDGKTAFLVKLPNQDEFQGFSVNWARGNVNGFELSIEWGTRNYYEKLFKFECQENKIYLTEIDVRDFDKQFPDKWNESTVAVTPKIALENFVINDFMQD